MALPGKSPRSPPRIDEIPSAVATSSYVHLLRSFANTRDLQSGILIHDRLVSQGLDRDPALADHLVHMYVKCGSLDTARSIFDRMPRPGILSWTRIIAGYAQRGDSDEAMAIFRRLLRDGINPGRITLIAALEACCGSKSLPAGRVIHVLIVAAGWESCPIVSTALIGMYVSCGSLRDAVLVFKKMEKRDVIAWTEMIAGFAVEGHLLMALLTYRRMLLEGFLPKVVTLLVLLNALAENRDWIRGRWIHRQVTELELESDVAVAAALITLFGKCGDLKKARRVFRRIQQPDLACYRALLVAHTENGEFWNAVLLSRKVIDSGVVPDRETVLAALAACIRPIDLEHGKEIHVSVINHGLERDLDVANALVYMYSKCGSLRDAEWMFHRMEKKNVISWRILISAYVKHDFFVEALRSFQKMVMEGYSPGRNACVGALRATGSLELLTQGRAVHLIVRERGLESHSRVVNAVVEMYGSCKSLEDARRVFDAIEQPKPSSWSSMVAACVEAARMDEALVEFRRMQLEGVKASRRSSSLFVNCIAACSSLRDLTGVYDYIVEVGAGLNSAVGNALLAAYCRLDGTLDEAARVLAGMDYNRDREAWNSVFALFGQQAETRTSEEVLSFARVGYLFRRMLFDGIKPDKTTFTLVLNAFMEEEEDRLSIEDVTFVYSCILECELDTDATIASLLLAVYGRCRALDEACAIFNKSHVLGTAVWNAMVATFAENGLPENGFLLFQRMAREGVLPNRSTFVLVCKAISSVGAIAVEQGKIIHAEAVQLGVELDPIVAAALIDMHSGCLRLDAAMDVFYRMEHNHRTTASWDAMVAAYRKAGERELALELLHEIHLEGFAFQLRPALMVFSAEADSTDLTVTHGGTSSIML